MANYHVFLKSSGIDPDARARVLAAIYREILRWDDPPEKQTELASVNLGRDEMTSSENEMSVLTDETISTPPVPQQTADKEKGLGSS